VLGAGRLEKRVTVAALAFSQKAFASIRESGGRCLTIEELMRENPKGSRIKIMGFSSHRHR